MKCGVFLPSILAAMALVSLASRAQAANDAVLSTTSTLGVLQYRVIDLDPDDGIQASVTFDPAGTMRLYAFDRKQSPWSVTVIEEQDLDRTGMPFSDALSGAIELTGGRALADVTAGHINASSVYDAERMAAMLAATPAGNSVEYRQDAGGRLSMQFTLSPNALIEFSASGNLGQLADVAALRDNSGGAPVTANLSASLGGLILGMGGADGDVTFQNAFVGRTIKLDALGEVLSDQSRASASSDLFLRLSNSGQGMLTSTLELSVFSSVTQSFSPRPPVPEPGTWALMGLGLVGVAAATRRRARTASC